MNNHSLLSGLAHFSIPRLAAVMLVALAWCGLAYSGEIHDAARYGELEKVKALLKDNPDLVFSHEWASGYTPLQMAACMGHLDIVTLLLTNRSDLAAKDRRGKTPLHLAAITGMSKDVVVSLLNANAEVDARDNFGETPLYDAAASQTLQPHHAGRPHLY